MNVKQSRRHPGARIWFVLLLVVSGSIVVARRSAVFAQTPIDCDVPGANCETDYDPSSGGGDGDPSDTDGSEGLLWPSGFGVIGTYNDMVFIGHATHVSGNTYTFSAFTDNGWVTGTIWLGIGEAALIDLGETANIDNWRIDSFHMGV